MRKRKLFEYPAAPGDAYVFYTDGVSEAFNAAGELFGEDRLLAQVGREPGTTAAEAVAGVPGAVRAREGEHPRSDDITILAVRLAP